MRIYVAQTKKGQVITSLDLIPCGEQGREVKPEELDGKIISHCHKDECGDIILEVV